MVEDLVSKIADLKEDEVLRIVRDRLGAGEDPLSILDDVGHATEIIGKRYADGEYFISELVYSGEILKGITDLVRPRISKAEVRSLGKVIIGTVEGDIHNIGKDIVAMMLSASGFEVFDLGVDVPTGRFVEKIRETGAPIVGLSGLLTTSFESMKQTIEAIKDAGLRDRVKIMIGGGLVNEDVRKYTSADGYGKDVMTAVSVAREWVRGP